MILQVQLDLPMQTQHSMTPETAKKLDLTKATVQQLKELCHIPNGGWPKDENLPGHIETWLAANQEANTRIQQEGIQNFKARGSAQSWFSSWKPKSKAMQDISEGIETAIDVIESGYDVILKRGMNHSEDSGLLQYDRQNRSEGIRVKKEPYGETLLIQILSVTGPTNFDPSDGTIEFEPGSRSHLFMLAYETLPTKTDLEADICTFPIIRDPSNYLTDKNGKNKTYRSEGFTNPRLASQGLKLHTSWNKLSPQAQKELIQKAQP